MFWISKLLGLYAMGKTTMKLEEIHAFLSSLAAVVGFTVIASMITGTLLLLAFYGGYLLLLDTGISSASAIMLIILFMLVLLIIFSCIAHCHMKQLYELPKLFQENSGNPIINYAQSIADAFMDGYNNTPPSRRRKRR